MRINRFIAAATGCSRRAADELIESGKVIVNGQPATLGQEISELDEIVCEGKKLEFAKVAAATPQLIMLNKPAGYVCSRNGQGSKTIYDLLPPELHNLKPIGRLDKDSSGLLLLTNDGELAHKLTHPSFHKMKCYEIELDKPLTPKHWKQITQAGIQLDDGPSKFELHWLEKNNGYKWTAILYEGRNRQIRRTFAALGYEVIRLHRTRFGDYTLGNTASRHYTVLGE